MFIKTGCEIAIACDQPGPFIAMLQVHPDRADALCAPDDVTAAPAIPLEPFLDQFGNRCVRGIAPVGELRLTADTLVNDPFELDAFTAFKILESKETPGLGDRVEVEPHFLASFERLDASLTPDGSALANAIVTVKEGEKVAPWQIDGITGATITSEAIGNILNETASSWVPALERDADSFAGRTPAEESE